MLGKNGLTIRIQQGKSYQNYELILLCFEKVLKMQDSVIDRTLLLYTIFLNFIAYIEKKDILLKA